MPGLGGVLDILEAQKMLKMPQNPTRQVPALLGDGFQAHDSFH
jgi:hypothetical protein